MGHGPYVQSERNASGLYLEYAKQLIDKGAAYYCFCDKERLDSLKSKVSEEGTEIVAYDKHCLGLAKKKLRQILQQENLMLSASICRQREPQHFMMRFMEILL